MKRLVLALSFVAAVAPSLAHAGGRYDPYGSSYGSSSGGDVYVRPYSRSDGAYVEGHHRSAPDGNSSNNWSTQGNVNPYTGRPGTRNTW